MLLILTLPVCCCAFLKLIFYKNIKIKLLFYYPCVAPIFIFKWNKEILNNNNHHNHSNSHDNEMVIIFKMQLNITH